MDTESSREYINRAARHVVRLIWEQFHNVIEALCVYVCVCKCNLSLIKVTQDCALTGSQAEQQRLEHNSLASWTHYLNDAIPHASISTHLEMEQLQHLLRHSNVSPAIYLLLEHKRVAWIKCDSADSFPLPNRQNT